MSKSGELFQDKYKVDSTRLKWQDYADDGWYFVTICSGKRKIFFGNIVDFKVVLNNTGLIVQNIWLAIPSQFKYVSLDSFIIMPNHIHGIIVIDYWDNINKIYNRRDAIYRVSEKPPIEQKRDAINRVSTGGVTGKYNPMGKQCLGEVIRWFKGRTSYEISKRCSHINFSWQPNFFDHIIRDQKSLYEIRDYIYYNPLNWIKDRNNPINFNK